MILFHRFTIPDVSIAVYIKSSAADKTNTLWSCCVINRSVCTYVSEIASQVISSLKWPLWPHINNVLLFLVVERGLSSYSMSLHQVCILIIPKHRNDMYQKSLLTEILPSEVSYLYWYESKLYIWYCCQLLKMGLISNFCFWAVFSHISWFEIHHIVGVWYVIYISEDISDSQMITSVHM